MSLAAAKRALHWAIVDEALEAANVDVETREIVAHAKSNGVRVTMIDFEKDAR